VKPKNNNGKVGYRWRFVPEGEGAKIWDKGAREPLPAVNQAPGDSAWEGKAAHGGKVSVLAVDDEWYAHAHVTFEVMARYFGIDPGAGFEGSGLKIFMPIGKPNSDLGLNMNSFGRADVKEIFEGVGTGTVGLIADGPNKGYAYLTGASYNVKRRWAVNERLYPDGPAELPWEDTTVNHWFYLNDLQGAGSSRTLLDAVKAHEKYGWAGNLKGHQRQIESAFTTRKCGDGATLAERVVAETVNEAEDLVRNIELAAKATLWEAASHKRVHSFLSPLQKVVRYHPPSIPDPDPVYFWDKPDPKHGPEPGTDDIPAVVSSRCDWSF